ncbi:alpha/beta fold hydrolase [Brevibacillus sp. HB1.2]|uniref:Alpha/beta hydrolase n=1 Tax=Brevibacillus porteri TaxID=2126350 RepID=A0ABX5FQG5_9BACL|nr:MULTISPECIES: alpha/beta fold hydrolase [Brevibacillus]ATF11688.1 alpha/beta hydrolase [Brevibacillus brevis X23]MDC0763195.1 alpha/beta fold hydrolase [Brevibacillus sp. AG]MED1800599.1 alpha/beta fold hydrolase [Brevibacillus porteri]MED2134773.1 alpha/beta fold hydrolase [Brevibacillus porteri]MED2745570.1 alpha/beta fold hydrolase [Brevibacillus porteri]
MSQARKKWFQALVLVTLGAICLAIWYLQPYQPDQAALTAMQGGEGITVMDTNDWIIFQGGESREPGLILYPGALVKPESYAPIARALAGYGYHVFLARMPLNLAVSDMTRATQVLKAYPNKTFVIGGHSLGGTMAAQFAANHPDRISGVFLLGAYPNSQGNLKKVNLPVLSLLGSRDGVIHIEKFEESKQYLPERTVYMSIEGGNHSQFGSYGSQEGDQPAAITPQEQWQQTVAAIKDWLLNEVTMMNVE